MGKYQGYEKYKESRVEWLGAIPEHWKRLSLRWLIQTSSGDFISNLDTEPEITNEVFIPVVGGNGIMSYTNKKNTNANSLVVGRVGAHCGNVHLFKENTWVTDNALLITIKPKSVHSDFLFWLLKSLNLNDTANKNAQPLITGEMIKGRSIAIPPLDEQESIAYFLDRKTSQIDALIAKKAALLEKLDEKRTALISHAVTKGLDSSVPMKDSGVEWLGDIPEHWDTRHMKRVADISYGVGGEIDRSLTDGINLLSLPNVTRDGNLLIDESGFCEISESEKSEVMLKKGDLLFNWRNGSSSHLGKTAYFDLDGEWTHVSFLLRIRFDRSKFCSKYFQYMLTGLRITGFFIVSKAGVNNTFNLNELSNLKVICPVHREQQQIANYLDQKTADIDRQKAKVKEAIELLKEYRTALITNAVTGKIDVRQVANV